MSRWLDMARAIEKPSIPLANIPNIPNTPEIGGQRGKLSNIGVLASIDEMEPLGFEDWVMDGLRNSYQVSRTPRTGDRGADIIARDPIGARDDMIVQCKHTQTQTPCSEEAVEDLLRANNAYPLRDPKLVAVTNAVSYVAKAKSMAQEHGIILIAREELPNWPKNILR